MITWAHTINAKYKAGTQDAYITILSNFLGWEFK